MRIPVEAGSRFAHGLRRERLTRGSERAANLFVSNLISLSPQNFPIDGNLMYLKINLNDVKPLIIPTLINF